MGTHGRNTELAELIPGKFILFNSHAHLDRKTNGSYSIAIIDVNKTLNYAPTSYSQHHGQAEI